MLKEIYCDKFISNNQIRKKITFNPVLNVVEGNDNGKNSIGKSTFLMCIDFCFGGNDYVTKLSDVSENVGVHTICFAFEFDKIYYFCRSTDNPNEIAICDENYNRTGTILKRDEYTSFLKEMYNIPIADLSFRQIVGRYLRIYNRENTNEKLPLRAHENESEATSINELIKLFGLYNEIKSIKEQSELADAQKNAFKKAQDFKYLPNINESQYKINCDTIERLTREEEELAERSDKGILDLSAEKAERVAQLKSELATLKRKRSILYTQLNLYKKDADYSPTSYEKNFSELSTFFDNVKIHNLKEIEDFHIQLSKILKKELTKAINDTWLNINLLTDAINECESELEQVQNTHSISKVVFSSYAAIDRQIEQLKKTNEYHLQKKKLDEDAKRLSTDLENKTMEQITILLRDLNAKMKEINNTIYNEGTSAPILIIKSPSSYKFETPNDLGTGTKYKGMIILDLAVLNLTPLPVIVHDSAMFSNMEFERIEKTFSLYAASKKQIFVAVDKTLQLNEKTREIIRENSVLQLSPGGNELFGRAWNKQNTDKEPN